MPDEDEERRAAERRLDPSPYGGPERRRHERRGLDWGTELNAAIDRLTEFRAAWKAGEQIDDRSRLNAHDLDLILEQLTIEPAEPTAARRVGGE